MAIDSDFRARLAEAAIGAYRIVKAGTAPQSAVLAAAATDKLLGTNDAQPRASGEQMDLAVGPVPKVVLGGTVAAGDAITSDATGAGIATTTTGNRIIGFAETPGVATQVITYLRAPGVV